MVTFSPRSDCTFDELGLLVNIKVFRYSAPLFHRVGCPVKYDAYRPDRGEGLARLNLLLDRLLLVRFLIGLVTLLAWHLCCLPFRLFGFVMALVFEVRLV
jgi:hypothetical protein